MALNDAPTAPSLAAPSPASWRNALRGDAAAVLLATLVFVALQIAQGLPDLLTVKGDNDSLMRLVELRDWLGGQGWFDLHQFRMGVGVGFVMHWSRLVDAPLGLLVLLGSGLFGSRAAGELFAQIAWPCLMFAGCLFALVKISCRIWGGAALLPAVVLGVAALHFPGIFALGNIDHHSFQLLLTLCVVALLLREGGTSRQVVLDGAAAGACAVLMLGIGAETTPYVAAAALFVALRFGFAAAPREQAIGFGLSFAATAALIFLGTVPPASWTQTACDAFSAPQGLLAVVGGLGLAGIAAFLPAYGGRGMRLAALGLLGLACGGLAAWLFPQCLGDPYAAVDPRLKEFWLNGVAEAQPFPSMVRKQPPMALGFYATPFLAVCLLAWFVLRRKAAPGLLLLPGLMLLAAVAVSLWQVRGAFFAVPLAVPLLAGFVMLRRQAAEAVPAPPGAAVMALLAWLVCLPIAWAAPAAILVPMTPSELADTQDPLLGDLSCEKARTLDALAAQPPGRVLAISNMGSLILANTPHSVLAGPYHRNTAGNLATLDAWTASPGEAERQLEAAGIGMVAFCPANPESRMLVQAAPGGLIGQLQGGRVPAWLSPVAGTETAPLRLFRMTGAANR